MSELVLPITLWNGPPPHSITSTLFVLSRAVLVTGSSSGQLCIWSIETEKPNKEGGLTPLIVCMGHNAPIKALVECNFEGKDAFVSMSTDGVVHVWSAQDGKCLGGTTFTSFYPLSLVCIPGDRRLIAVAGSHSEIEVIDTWTLKSTTTLRAHSDWITCLASILCNGEPVLMSGSRDGLVHFWSLKPNEDFPLRTVCFDEGPVPSMHPLEMSMSPDLRSFVLVTGSKWQLYTAQNSRLVCSVACPEGSEWLGAKYLDNDTLLVWTSHALAAAYKLSIPSHAEPLSLIPSANTNVNIEMPKNLSATFDMNPNGETALKILSGVQPGSVFVPVRSGSQIDTTNNYLPTVLYTINEFPLDPVRQTTSQETQLPKSEPALPDFASLGHRYESSFSQFAACSDSFFAVGDTTGHVAMWIVRSDNFAAWCGGRISDGWKGVESPAKAVTTSLVIEDQLLLIRGHENGQISTCNLPTDPFPKYNKAHSARVNCLMCSPMVGTTAPAANAAAPNPISTTHKRFLISGSDDFTIKVWELATFELLHTFTHHTGPVTCLFPPPPRSQQGSEVFWDNTYPTRAGYYSSLTVHRFFAVSDDKCVGFYSMDSMVCRHMFGVHPALVSAVKSRRDQDYLLVECADGCVAVWEMGTGELEAPLSVCSIWTNHSSPQGVSLVGSPTDSGSVASPAGVRMLSLPNLQRSPIQILFLDIKQIIRELYRTQVSAPAAIQANNASSSKKPVPSTSSSSLTNGPAAASSSSTNILASGSSINTSGGNLNSSGSGTSSSSRQRQSLQLSNQSTGAAITSLPAYQVFSYLIPWGVDKAMDTLCKKEMMLRPPVPDFAFGIKGDCGNISVLVPSASGVGRWQCSPELTALITLSAVSLAKALLNLGDGKNSCIQILSYYCALLPETLGPRSSYVDPSLPLLASYWLDPLEDIMSAARSILVSTIDRLSPDDRKELTQSVALQLKQATESHTRGLLVVVLGIIGAERPEALDELAARSSVIELLKILYKGGTGPFTQAAVELLGKGFATWRAHIKDVTRLVRALFALSLQNDSLGQTAHHALMLIGAQDPKQFILCIGAEIHRDNSTHAHALPNNSSPAIMLLGSLIKKDSCALLGQLPRLVETVVKSLDPHTPALRDACLKATTAVLQIMVKKYPMVSFHQDSQRLAVGTSENVIIIYDLKTATRWHVLEGHKNAVSAVAFNENGKALASYSILETTVRIWHTGTSFFGILGSQPQCVKTFTVSKPNKIISPQVQLETVRLQWVSPSTLTLFRGWEQGTTFTVDPVM